MAELRILTAPEQVAEWFRRGILAGEWVEIMPGESVLSAELGLDAKIVGRALRQLEEEGLLENQGKRRRRRIVSSASVRLSRTGPLRIAMLGGAANHRRAYFLGDLPYLLSAAGHAVFFAKRSTVELGDHLGRIEGLVRDTEADAWIVLGGSSKLLGWFEQQPTPVISVWGRHHGMTMARVEPDRSVAYAGLANELIGLGHRKMVMMARHGRRMPTPGPNEQTFLDVLGQNGIQVSSYHLPDWVETGAGYQEALERLFKLTPPTAIIVDDVSLFTVTLQFLAGRGLKVPADVSLACTENEQSLGWCEPEVSHISWNRDEMINRVLKWAKRISMGKPDVGATSCKAWFVRGGTIGPVANSRRPT